MYNPHYNQQQIQATTSSDAHATPDQDQPPKQKLNANERVLQDLRMKLALKRSALDPENNQNPRTEDIEVTRFDIHDQNYLPQTIYVFPIAGDSSDQTLRRMIEEVTQDSILITSIKPGLRLVSFDMEWTTDHRAKRARPTSLIQICGQTKTLIIQLSQISRQQWASNLLPLSISEFLRNPRIIKFGVGITGDADKLNNHDNFTDSNGQKVYLNCFLELMQVAKLVDPSTKVDIPDDNLSLQRFVARYLDQFLCKSKRIVTSNWESSYLTPTQLTYAASDVISAMRVYLKLYALPAHDRRFIPPIKYAFPRAM
ncbi:hypothetical protein MJO28_013016 [Puccinia striiformis f. sp. tritici]|uniref:Uncharacterized protein n=1 Tax=Puccinia striiformis f. sp. tritici TaxID=168172 RepID=A0ACC0DXB3_9BASI|nr:hypothetical protein Pst134EB_025176 [Puccinia striiformis f. sp. tritici]KAI7940731.1 hypothetical protein MJO28_013016 [Puccinia striiformis f. sp. tritici]KAI7943209.1 hypothetical protein MJO29_013053 [Puccinia striiformis f. sp. tritici]KAI9629778.1 hypothetical protein KEM48_012604 [Puccinia striiformis f. sp. tritici PST-130]